MLLRRNYKPAREIKPAIADRNYENLFKEELLVTNNPLEKTKSYWAAGNVLEIDYNSQSVKICGDSKTFKKTEEVTERLLETKLFWILQER